MKTFVVAVLVAFAITRFGAAHAENPASATKIGCDVGLYSQYINTIGGPVDSWHEPVVQGGCRATFANGAYVDGWMSQSTRSPGLQTTLANEADVTVGYTSKFGERWSADIHAAYLDLANSRLLQGTNGDLANGGGTLRYQATGSTSVYANVEGFHGLGDRGFGGGWRSGFGARTLAGPVTVDGGLYHNQNFFGHGQFVKVMVEPTAPMAKFAGGGIRPTIFFYQPLGQYGKTFDRQIVTAVHITW